MFHHWWACPCYENYACFTFASLAVCISQFAMSSYSLVKHHFLGVYFFSIDPQHFVDGSTSSPGYSVIGENPGLFKFCSFSPSFLIIISIPEAKFTLATFQLTLGVGLRGDRKWKPLVPRDLAPRLCSFRYPRAKGSTLSCA